MKNEERHVVAKGLMVTPRLVERKHFKERPYLGEEITERVLSPKPNLLKKNISVAPNFHGRKRTKPLV